MDELVDNYLIAIFLEVRLMANYVRRTAQVFDGASELLRPYDYIIISQLKGAKEIAVETWRTAFIRGLRGASAKGNIYIASVFHNVLATYYLNRANAPHRFQKERLRGRVLYIDTNILYAALVEASSYHNIVVDCLRRLRDLGFTIKIFPFSVQEYEFSLKRVVGGFVNGQPVYWLAAENPWLLQEFNIRKARYFTVEACRQVHSVAKKGSVTEADYDAIDNVLAPHGLLLERDVISVDPEEIKGLWSVMVTKMASNSWDMDRWWEFRYTAIAKSDQTIDHDVQFMTNVERKASAASPDDFGPRTLLLTLDHTHLLRLRRSYPFVIGVKQCLEFFLPYLFLTDVPVKESVQFPNRLLDTQLGVMLATRPLRAQDAVMSFLAVSSEGDHVE